jgi:hypothetical protein
LFGCFYGEFVFPFSVVMDSLACSFVLTHQEFTADGARRSLERWKDCHKDGNCAAANRRVLPCLGLQSQGYELGLGKELDALKNKLLRLKASHEIAYYPTRPSSLRLHTHDVCGKCGLVIDYASVDGQCPCVFD